MLNERQQKLMKILEEAITWMRGKHLSMLLDVSDRTIRSDIDKINQMYPDVITSSSQSGYLFNVQAFQSSNAKSTPKNIKEIPQNTDERCFYIIRKLLFDRREVNIISILDELCVSEFTLENDLKKLKKMLKPYPDLKFIRNKKFISLMGSEEAKRKLYKSMLNIETKKNFLNFNTLASLFKSFDFIMVKNILEDTLEAFDFHLKETTFPMLLMHVGIALERILHRNFIYNDRNIDDLSLSVEYQIANSFYEKIKDSIQIEIVNEEIVLLTMLLMGRKSFSYTDPSNILSSLDEEQLVHDLLLDIKQAFDLDFTKDSELTVGLRIHIRSLIDRSKNNAWSPNVFLSEIKRKYPLVFEMGVQVCNFLEKKLTIQIDENEIGFIALHLGVAYERINVIQKYRAVLIVAHEESFSNGCQKKILQKFADRLDIIARVNYFDERKIQLLDPDLLITTSEITHSLNIPTIMVSIFFDLEDEGVIFQKINKLDKQKFHNKVSTQINEYINPKYFYYNLDIQTPEECIRKMCQKLEDDGQVETDFKNSVMDRERISSTSFFYSFATPHSLKKGVLHSNISIAILKNPIRWGEFDVKLVLLIAIREEDKKVLKLVFDWLSKAINDVESFSLILESKSYEEFIGRFLTFNYSLD